jgi:arabinan endo-1,5-alpha-L-arabinosidase
MASIFTYAVIFILLAQSSTCLALPTNNYPSPYPNPEPCHGNCSWIHDPSIFYDDGTYWRFSTSGNIAMATASSLEGPWEYRGALLHNGTKIHVADDQDIWASLYYGHCFYA